VGWELVALALLVWGGKRVWSGRRMPTTPSDANRLRQWIWAVPLLASVVGATSAVLALAAKHNVGHDHGSLLVAAIASIGVVLSWMMLQIGFAQVYHAVDSAHPGVTGIEFPNLRFDRPSALDYLYFAFTMGTSFATSDASVRTVWIRRIVLVHSVVAFPYNALVVAVAFQVLQDIVG